MTIISTKIYYPSYQHMDVCITCTSEKVTLIDIAFQYLSSIVRVSITQRGAEQSKSSTTLQKVKYKVTIVILLILLLMEAKIGHVVFILQVLFQPGTSSNKNPQYNSHSYYMANCHRSVNRVS